MNRMLPVLVVALAVVFGASQAPARPQSQAGPTTGTEMMPPFDPRYFLGVWEVEWSPPDLGLIPGGAYTGTETVTHLRNRYLKVVVALEHEDGTQLNGEGVMFYEYGLNGQSLVRYVAYDAGFSVLQSGAIGGDLGGYYSFYWDTPEITANGQTFALRGRSYFVSPAAYRVNQEISQEGADFFNFGTMWLRKVADAADPAAATEISAIQDLELAAADLEVYAGQYRVGPLSLRVFVESRRLMMEVGSQPSTRLRAQGDHLFVPEGADEARVSFTVTNGRATRATYRLGTTQFEGERVDP